MSDRKDVEVFKSVVRTGARTAPRPAEPLVEGSSIYAEDARTILDELRARHRVTLLPNEPEDALEGPGEKSGSGPAAALAGRSEAGPTSDPEDEDETADEDIGHHSRMRKMRLRLARLELEIGKLQKGKGNEKKAEK